MQYHEEHPEGTTPKQGISDQENSDTIGSNETHPSHISPSQSSFESRSSVISSADEAPPVQDKDLCYEDIRHLVIELSEHFESKLKYDKHKELIIDRLHKENQAFKEDLYKKLLKPLLMELIMLYDDYAKLSKHYSVGTIDGEQYGKLLHHFNMIHQDLEDVLYKYGVEPFEVAGNELDAARQRVISTVPTSDERLDKTLCERLKKGFDWEGILLRPEHISCYEYQASENQ